MGESVCIIGTMKPNETQIMLINLQSMYASHKDVMTEEQRDAFRMHRASINWCYANGFKDKFAVAVNDASKYLNSILFGA